MGAMSGKAGEWAVGAGRAGIAALDVGSLKLIRQHGVRGDPSLGESA